MNKLINKEGNVVMVGTWFACLEAWQPGYVIVEGNFDKKAWLQAKEDAMSSVWKT